VVGEGGGGGVLHSFNKTNKLCFCVLFLCGHYKSYDD